MANFWEAGGASGVVAAYEPLGAPDLASSYVNRANPGTYDAAVGGGASAPTFDAATGWGFDGTGRWLTTGIASYQPMTVLVRARTTDLSTYRSWISAVGGAGGWHFYHTVNPGNTGKADLTRGGVTAIGTSSGVYPSDGTSFVAGATFSAGDEWTFYKDGAPNGSGTTAVPDFVGIAITIGDGSHGVHHYGTIAAVAMYDNVLDAATVAAVSAAMAALPTGGSWGGVVVPMPILMSGQVR